MQIYGVGIGLHCIPDSEQFACGPISLTEFAATLLATGLIAGLLILYWLRKK